MTSSIEKIIVFISQFLGLLKQVYREKPLNFYKVILLDAVAAITKIFSVYLLATFATFLANSGTTTSVSGMLELVTFGSGYEGLLQIAIGFFVLSFVSTILFYRSISQARALGRWFTSYTSNRIAKQILKLPYSKNVDITIPTNPNILFTQTPIHLGLATENALRLINPLILAFVCYLALLFQSKLLATTLLVAAIFSAPVFLLLAIRIRANAKLLYGTASQDMGKEITSITSLLLNQFGGSQLKFPFGLEERVTTFYDSLDKNLLANQKTTLFIGLTDSLIRPIFLIVLGYLILESSMPINEVIIILGIIAYLFSAIRQVFGFITNLVRFHPQMEIYTKLDKVRTDIEAEGHASVNDNTGQKIILLLTNSITLFDVRPILNKIQGMDINISDKQKIIYINAKFRYFPNTNLANTTGKNLSKFKDANPLLQKLAEEFQVEKFLEKNWDSAIDDKFWNSLNGKERFIIRTLAVLQNVKDKDLIFIDWTTFSTLTGQEINIFFDAFGKNTQSSIFIWTPDLDKRLNQINFDHILDGTQNYLKDYEDLETANRLYQRKNPESNIDENDDLISTLGTI